MRRMCIGPREMGAFAARAFQRDAFFVGEDRERKPLFVAVVAKPLSFTAEVGKSLAFIARVGKMTALKKYEIYQGDTVVMDFLILQPSGLPQNLSSVTLRWAMSDPDEIDTPILQKSEGDGIVVTSAAEGRCTVTVPAGEIDTPGNYIHELEVEFSTGSTYTYGQGMLIVKPTVYPQ